MEKSDRIRPNNFFRTRLIRITDNDELAEMMREMRQDQNDLSRIIARIMWHMRGSLSREEAWTLSAEERNDILKLIEEHRELTEKTGLPLM